MIRLRSMVPKTRTTRALATCSTAGSSEAKLTGTEHLRIVFVRDELEPVESDSFGFPNTSSNSNGRGAAFLNPAKAKSPNGQLSWVHTFSPTVLNEARVGYALNITGDATVAQGGIPDLRFDDGMMGFGSYSGYPQTFHENIYSIQIWFRFRTESTTSK